jgi:large subunit ribosomal protein L16
MKLYFTPKKQKYKKYFRSRLHSINQPNLNIKKGSLALQSLEKSRISVEQMEAFRRTFRRYIKKKGRVIIAQKANLRLTAKPAEVRMGSGKGNPAKWIIKTYKASILFEFKGIPILKAIQGIKKASSKLSVKTKIIYK